MKIISEIKINDIWTEQKNIKVEEADSRIQEVICCSMEKIGFEFWKKNLEGKSP